MEGNNGQEERDAFSDGPVSRFYYRQDDHRARAICHIVTTCVRVALTFGARLLVSIDFEDYVIPFEQV